MILISVFAVGLTVSLVGTFTRRGATAIAGYTTMAMAVVAFPLVSAVARLVDSPLPADAALAWLAFDLLFSVVEVFIAIGLLVWIVRMRPKTVDDKTPQFPKAD